MTPTEAARMMLDIDPDKYPATCSDWASRYGHTIARTLLDAQARIADLEGALRQICELTEDYEHNQQLSEVWYVANDALTPEGGGK